MRRYVATVARLVPPLLRRRPPAEPPLSSATIDLRAPDVARDPFPRYEALRQEGSVLFLPRHDYWIVLSHEAVRSAFSRPEYFSNALYRNVDAVLLAADPPEHTAIRRIVAKFFSPTVTARLEDTASRLADALVRPELDVVSDYGIPVSRGVTADLLGLDETSVDDIVAAETRSKDAADPVADFIVRFDAMAHRSSMFDALIDAGVPDESARSLVRLMWLAGITTTQRLIAHAVLRLIGDEQDQQALRTDPALMRPFLEEVLRLHPPEHVVLRVARADVELDGVMIPAGAQVRLCLSAANRDPAHYDQPDQHRLDRGSMRHFTLGAGAHACIGAHVGRATASIAVATLLRRSSVLRSRLPPDEIRYFATETALSPESLQVRL